MKQTIHIIFLIIILAFSGCKKDDVKVQGFNIVSESIVKNTSTIVLTVRYNYITTTASVDGYISESNTMNNSSIFQGEINDGVFIIKFTGLQANTTYYYCYEYSYGIDNIAKSETKVITTNDYELPTVTTNDVTDISVTSATLGGYVVDDGELEIIARGVCWSTNEYPTISDSHTLDGTGTGSYTSNLSDLSSYTTYYVRAYATNTKGTNYGEQKSFKTKYDAPIGAIAGVFSVGSTKKVCFSKGNLQYQATTNTWRFATNQYDYVGNSNSNISGSYSGWIDLFGWGTSGYNHGAICYQPYSINNNSDNYFAYGNSTNHLNGQTGQADWGYNAISNGGNNENMWRTLTIDEWWYVINSRSTPSGIKRVKAIVNGVNGLILLPDDWDNSYYDLKSTNLNTVNFDVNVISAETWENDLESHGAVFLPAAGDRFVTTINFVDISGKYWSASANTITTDYARAIDFSDDYLYSDFSGFRYLGYSVRLVYDAE